MLQCQAFITKMLHEYFKRNILTVTWESSGCKYIVFKRAECKIPTINNSRHVYTCKARSYDMAAH